MYHDMHDAICPRCKQSGNHIRSVRAIVTSGTTITSSYNDEVGYFRGISTSQLAQLLMPPSEPNPPRAWNCGVFIGFVGILFVSIALLGSLNSSTAQDPNPIISIIGNIIIVGITLTALIYLYKRIKNKQRQLEQLYPLQRYEWDKQMQNWFELYYCPKHDIVFSTRRKLFSTPDRMMNLL